MPIQAILDNRVGSVVAPAGCGKTQLVTQVLSTPADKPCLVLTHTTAGVAALKNRSRDISSGQYRIATIAGWALNLANMFPGITGYRPPGNSPPDYDRLQEAVASLLERGNLSDSLKASYSRVLVDEYQDCTNSQHQIVCALASVLPVVIFGDPMQSIFDFAGPLPKWERTVIGAFPTIASLDTPWRWNNAGAPNLGRWILEAREKLLAGQLVDLQSCPGHVTWHQLTGNPRDDHQLQIAIQYQIRQNMKPGDRLLIIGDSIDASSRHRFAQRANGIGVVEPVDLRDVVSACRRFDRLEAGDLLGSASELVSKMMTGVNSPGLVRRVTSIIGGRNRTPPTPVEAAAVALVRDSTRDSLLNFVKQVSKKPGTKIYRRDAYQALLDAIKLAVSDPDRSMHESAAAVREQRRHRGDKRIPTRAIGSTLLLKGLEAEYVVILNADKMNAKHLYVALSRGAKSVSVFSRKQHVGSKIKR